MVHYPERVGVVINSVVIVLSVICILSNVESIRKQKKSGKGKGRVAIFVCFESLLMPCK